MKPPETETFLCESAINMEKQLVRTSPRADACCASVLGLGACDLSWESLNLIEYILHSLTEKLLQQAVKRAFLHRDIPDRSKLWSSGRILVATPEEVWAP